MTDTTIGICHTTLLDALTHHIGAHNGITCKELARGLTGDDSPHAMREIRHQVEELRREGFHICALPQDGYYMARNAEELDKTCEHLYLRAICSLTQVAAMRRVSLPDLRGQLRLPD